MRVSRFKFVGTAWTPRERATACAITPLKRCASFDTSEAGTCPVARRASENSANGPGGCPVGASVPNSGQSRLVAPRPFHEIPAPPHLPILGAAHHLVPYRDNRPQLYEQWRNSYGPLVRFKIFHYDHLLVFDPEISAEYWQNEGRNPFKPPVDAWLSYRKARDLPPGLTLGNGEEWRRFRHSVTRLLQPKVVDEYAPRIVDAAHGVADYLIRQSDRALSLPELYRVVTLYGMEVTTHNTAITSVALGARLGFFNEKPATDDAIHTRFVEATRGMLDTSVRLIFGPPFWRLWRTPTLSEHHAHWDTLHEVVAELRTRRRTQYKDDNVACFLDSVIATNALNAREMDTLAVEFALAGIDSTAGVATFLLQEIASRPAVQDRLHAEIVSVLGTDGRLVSSTQLMQMQYLKNCVAETLRLHPTTDALLRTVPKEIVLGGYAVPAGTWILLSNLLTGRDARHFARPLDFDPDRFLDAPHGAQDSDTASASSRFASLPFGFGPRSCVGRRVAQIQLWALVCTLVQNFRMRFDHVIDPPISGMTLKPRLDATKFLEFQPRS